MNKSYYKSPIGILEIVCENEALVSLKLVSAAGKSDNETDFIKIVRTQLDEYFSGERREFDIKLNPKGTDFQKLVWKKLREISYGKTKSYSDIANNVGNTQAQRAVGSACNKNPIMILIPCHRVISKTGKLGGFAYGESIKQKLLNIEAKTIIPYLFALAPLPAHADIVWPSLYITKGMLSIKTILLGLVIELLFVKYFTKTDWKQASITTVIMNLITTVLGAILIPLSGLGSEFVFDFVFHAYDKFGIGTFHWSHWLVSYLLVIIINTLIEGLYIKSALKLRLKQTFPWLIIANGISVLLCFLFYGINF